MLTCYFKATLKQTLAGVICGLLLAGCVSQSDTHPLSFLQGAPSANQGIVIIGVKGSARAVFRLGNFIEADESFEHFMQSSAAFSSSYKQPYIVRALNVTTADNRYGMYSATLAGREFSFKCNQVLPVISVDAGRVQYYGDFEVNVDGENITVKQTFDIKAAQRYVDEFYPNSAWKINPGKVVRARSTRCLKAPPAAILG